MKQWLTFLTAVAISLAAFGQKDISWDIKTGNEVAAKVEKSIGLIHLESAERTVKILGDRLVEKLESNPFTFSFQIIDQPEPNAFALPGGHVYISRGLLALMVTEDELAGVLGHEISHVIQRHSAKQQKKALLPTIIAVPGIILGSTIGGDLGEKVAAPLLGAGKLFLASYSRKQESEADALGISLAAKAGYEPSALGDILHRMELSLQSENGKSPAFSFFNDHPMTPDRMKAIYSQSQTTAKVSTRPAYNQLDFLVSFNHLLFGPNPSQGIFNKNIFLHPSLKIFWELPVGWDCINESSAAGAVQKDQQILLTIAGKDRQLDTLIENFVNGYYAKTRKEPISDKRLKMSVGTGSELILPASQSNMIIYTLWFRKDKMTYVIFATGDKSQTEVFRKSGMSFRDLAESDHALVTFQELITTKAFANETCQELAKRSGDTVPVKFNAIINGVAEDVKLKKDQPLKIILRKPFYP